MRSSSNVDVGYRLINTLDPGKGLHRLEDIGLRESWKDAKPIKIDLEGTIIELIDSLNQEIGKNYFSQLLLLRQ